MHNDIDLTIKANTVDLTPSAGRVDCVVLDKNSGYYIPKLSPDGVLSWVATMAGMAAPPAPLNIKGPAGDGAAAAKQSAVEAEEAATAAVASEAASKKAAVEAGASAATAAEQAATADLSASKAEEAATAAVASEAASKKEATEAGQAATAAAASEAASKKAASFADEKKTETKEIHDKVVILKNDTEAIKNRTQEIAVEAQNSVNDSVNVCTDMEASTKTSYEAVKGLKTEIERIATDVNVFVPHTDAEGYLSWTNKAGLPNPPPFKIKGEKGEKGLQGIQGPKGDAGTWGSIEGDITDQADLQTKLNAKLDADANAISATKLQTARTINGVDFDGTNNITIGGDYNDLENKPILNYNAFYEKVQNLGGLPSITNISVGELGYICTGTVNASTTINISKSVSVGGVVVTLILNLSGSYSVTWNSNILWSGGSAPELTSGINIINLISIDNSSVWYGMSGGSEFA